VVNDDNRSIHNEAKLRFFNAAFQFLFLDFVVTEPGGDPARFAVATLIAPGISDYTPLAPGDYDLYVRDANTFVMYAGPLPFTVAAGGIYSAMAVNGPDASTAGIVFLDGFQ
jgi:hypothetical protein